MRQRILLQFLVFVLVVLPLKLLGQVSEFNEVSFLSINSAITPATFDYLNQNFKKIPRTSFIVVKLNTPGGLVSTTKDIITMIGRERRPFAVWITPEGASASSAGAIIASAAHFILMSPGTNIGAATPVGLNDDLKESDGKRKALNDLTALVRSLSNSRGRPSLPFEKMIRDAESFTDKEALSLKIIDGIISSEKDIVRIIEAKPVSIDGAQVLLKSSDPVLKNYDPTLGQKIFEVLANPSTAYFLFLIGIALIYFELQAPGGYVSGTIGLCFLILAGMAFQALPLDWGSLALIAVGIFLLILEIFIVSYGLLTIAGLASFIIGSLFLFHGETGFITVRYSVMFSILAGVVCAVAILVWYLWNDKKKQKHVQNFFLPIGAQGTILTRLSDFEYQIKVRGEIWKAISEERFELNDTVKVSDVDAQKLTIKIIKAN